VLELRLHLGLALVAGAIALAGCGSDRASPAPTPAPAANREWVDNASRFVQQLQQDISMSATGGSNLASARRAVRDLNDVYILLVAYGDFDGCNRELAATGTPGPRGAKAAALIRSACRPLERAAALFEQAMQRNDARALLAATRTSATAAPILVRALAALHALG
jgi:hypothetical protein